MLVDLSGFELHNVMRTKDGFRTRKGFVSLRAATGGTKYVSGFTLESPFTTEPWHYLFEQATSTGITTLRILTEEFTEMMNLGLGVLQKDPVITHGFANGQLMVNSPAFSAPLYGLPGGGIITATKTASINPDTTALDIPAGHITSFADRFVIAQGNVFFTNDPPSANNLDPRTFVSQNAVGLPGTIYDLFQGPDGALYLFTSAGVYSLPMDALGQGQTVQGFLSRIPGLETTKPKNACATNGAVVVLQKDHIVLLPSQQKIELMRRSGRRYFSKAVEVEDLRLAGELHPIPDGFIVGFRGRHGFYLIANIEQGSVSYVWDSADTPLNVVGTLRSRDGESFPIFSDKVAVPFKRSSIEHTNDQQIKAVISGRYPLPEDANPVCRHLSLAADNIGEDNSAFVSGSAASTKTTPAKTSDVVIGTTAWSASLRFAGRSTRTTRHHFTVRTSEPSLELLVVGGGRRIDPTIDLNLAGQGQRRRDRP